MVPVHSASILDEGKKALCISYSESRNSLDLINDLEIWTSVQLIHKADLSPEQEKHLISSCLLLEPGFGVGKVKSTRKLCFSKFAENLLLNNLCSFVPEEYFLHIEIIFPKGKELAKRTSNESFGVVDGLALIGTQVQAQISASPEQLQDNIEELKAICSAEDFAGQLILVIGENGLDLARNLGLFSSPVLKVGNWLGPILVASAQANVNQLLILGYHGKLIKLAGGIFHTHHHLADARLEILSSIAIKEKVPLELIEGLGQSKSVEDAFGYLNMVNSAIASKLWFRIAREVESRSENYLKRYGDYTLQIGSALFDKTRQLRWAGPYGVAQLESFGITLPISHSAYIG